MADVPEDAWRVWKERADHVDIVFDGPPSHEAGRFIEVEDATGKSIKLGEWLQRPDGYWALRIRRKDFPE